MNKKICLLLLSLAMFMAVPYAVFGIGAPHVNSQSVGCTHCHNATATLSTNQFNNMCTSCHKPGSANTFITSKFYQTDAANIYNRFNGYSAGVIPSSKLMFTSHNWAGPVAAPEAGASKPTIASMNIKTLGTTLSCARCHNVHGDRSSTINSAPFLRTKNDNDEMCRDCHRKRDTSNHLLGSHPINFRYTSATSKVVAKPGEYFNPPRNANPANPTSAMKLVNGKIMCTSCHATHFADSNSGTVDSKEQWANLSSSRGMLLRSDTFGKTDAATSVNICTNCHNKPNHQVYPGSATNTMQIQCVDCHSGHVEYLKPEDVARGGEDAKPNVYMLRRYVNYSAGVKLDSYRRKAFLTSTSSTSILSNNKNSGVCQACHNLPSNVPDHLTATTKDKCIVCHGGSLHATQKPIGCTDCHGFPPQHTVKGTIKYGVNPSNGYGVYSSGRDYSTILGGSIFKNESTAGHPTHSAGKPYSYSCNECHKNNTHLKETYQDVNIDKNGMVAGFTPGGASSTCSNLYCHSYGTATLKGAKTVSWASGVRGSIVGTANECIACHNGVKPAAFDNLSTGSHRAHVSLTAGKMITCNVCHAATVSGNTTISNYAKHADGTRDVSFSGSLASGTTFNGTTCTTYCHSNGKGTYAPVAPNWTNRNSGKCGSCHLTAVSTGSGILSSGAHFTHISSSYGPKRNTNDLCGACHVFTGELHSSHVDGSISKQGGGAGATYCQNCHAGSVPVWVAGRLSCQSCHSGMGIGAAENVAIRSWSSFNGAADGSAVQAPYKSYSSFTNRGHGAFANSNSCSKCHNSTSKHFDGALGSADKRLFTANDNSQCSSCHAEPSIVNNLSKRITSTHATAKGGPYTMDCKICHEVHGGANGKMIKTSIVFGALTSTITYGTSNDLVSLTPPYRGLCQTCHTNTSHYRRNVEEGANHPTSGCLNCHSHKDTYAFKPKACDECHGYPPAPRGFVPTQSNFSSAKLENYSGGGGAHVKAGHILANVRPNQGFAPCVVCHNGGASEHVGRTAIFNSMTSPTNAQKMINTSVKVDPGYKFNAGKPLDASQYRKATPNNSGTCWNVSCHFQASPRWSVEK